MAKLRVGVLISGRGSNLQALIDAANLPDYPAEIVLVISNVPGAKGLDRAVAAGISNRTISHRDYDSRDSFEAEVTKAFEGEGVELICHAGFMRIVTDSFLARWPNRVINIHPSLLPSFKGLHVHEQALDAGVKMSGCTVHFVVPEMDSGPIIIQAAVPVLADDTPERLAARVLAAEHRIYPLALKWIAEGRVQIDGNAVRIEGTGAPSSPLLSPPEES